MREHTPAKDLGAVFDAHVKAEFVDMDVVATMATMTSPLLGVTQKSRGHEAPSERSSLLGIKD